MSERRACRIVKLSRASLAYEAKPNDDHIILDRMKEIVTERPRFGCPRVHYLLRREGLVKNHKRTARIYRLANLQIKNRRRKRRIFKPENPLPPLQRANERWSMDFVHDNLHDGRSIRMLTMIDEFSRESLAVEVDTSLSSKRVIRVLDRLKMERGLPLEIGIDQGPEFTSKILMGWAKDNGVNLHFCTPGDKNENAFIESFNGRLRDECLNASWFTSVQDARNQIEIWRCDYNKNRPHRSLGGQTPLEYAAKGGLRMCA